MSGSSRCRLTRPNVGDPLPSLHGHYTRFITTTEQSPKVTSQPRQFAATIAVRVGDLTDCSKIRTRWKIVIIFDHPCRTLVLDRRPGNRAAILRSEIHRHASHGCSDRRCPVRAIRRLDGEAVGGRRLARTPPRRVTRWLATSTIAPPAPALASAGDELPSPITLF